mgnify:CR=1 FL=1
MPTLIAVLFFLFISTASFSTYSSAAWIEIRDKYLFDRETKWNCFYRTTTSVKGLNPAVWRYDQYGNFLLAGLNFNCKGCLCYTFDHRYPISAMGNIKPTAKLIDLMSSIHNCQALAFRTNALKGSNEDQDIKSIVHRFGCDRKTMKLFEAKNNMGARAIEKYYLSSERIEQIHQYYINYLNGKDFLDPKTVNQSKNEYFKLLNKNAGIIENKIKQEYNEIINGDETDANNK